MKIVETKIKDLFVIEPNVFDDDRGWFFESYSEKELKDNDLYYSFVQDNHSYSRKRWTLRGLHFQNEPYAQAKLVRCTNGKILDVAVDLRKESPTYLKWFSIELTKENKKQLLVPRGFAHGFLTLTNDTEVQYKVDNYYDKYSDRSIQWDDPKIGVKWHVVNPILSNKDKNAPLLKDSDVNFK